MDYLQPHRYEEGHLLKKMPGFTFLYPFVSLSLPPHPILPHKLSVLFTIPLFPLWEQCVCSPPPPPLLHPFLSLHPFVWCSLWHLCHARPWGREGGTGPAIVPGWTHGISIVFFLSRIAKRWLVTFRIWWCQGSSFFGPFIWVSLILQCALHQQGSGRQCRIVCAVWLITALHQLSLTSTSCVWLCQQVLQLNNKIVCRCPLKQDIWAFVQQSSSITSQCFQNWFSLMQK